MRKKIVFWILLVFLVGCSGPKRMRSSTDKFEVGRIEYVDQLKSFNITNRDFDIQKIAIDYDLGLEDGSLIANLKYRNPDQYLISLRTKLGIEAIRAYIKGDSIYLHDKINKVLYRGDDAALVHNYGFSIKMLPLIFSDYVNDEVNDDPIQCSDGYFEVESYKEDVRFEYDVQCDVLKPKTIRMYFPKSPFPTTSNSKSKMLSAWPFDYLAAEVSFHKYNLVGDRPFPEDVSLEIPLDVIGSAQINMSFSNINMVDLTPINFIFSKNIKIVDLK